MEGSIFVTILAIFVISANCAMEPSGEHSLKTRQAHDHAEGSELLSSQDSQISIGGGRNVDKKSLGEIREDLARLTTAGSNLQTLIAGMNGILSNNGKSTGSAQYNLAGGYYPVNNFVKFYKTTHGFNGYPTIAGFPCAGIPSVATLPTIPVLVKRITADTTYLMDLYNRGLATTTTTSVNTRVANPALYPGGVVTSYDAHHH